MTEDLTHLDTIPTEQNAQDSASNLPARATPQVDDIYTEFDRRVRMAARKEQEGVMIVSRPGIGKSHRVGEILEDEAENDDSPHYQHEFVSGTITPLALHETLYANSGASTVLVFDDIEFSGYSNAVKIASALKSALEGEGNDDERIVEWRSGSKRLRENNVPQSFRFEGSIVFLRNDWPKSTPHWDAVLSRCLEYEFSLSFSDRMRLIREVAKSDSWDTDLDYTGRMETVEWLLERTTADMDNVDLRTLEQAFSFRDSDVIDDGKWKQLLLSELGYDTLEVLAKESVANGQNLFEAEILFWNTVEAPETRWDTDSTGTFFEQFDDPTAIEAQYVDVIRNVVIDSADDGERAVADDYYEQIDCAGAATDWFLDRAEYSSNKTFYERRDRDVGHMEQSVA